MPFTGSCLCGQVHYKLLIDELPSGVICHCKNCRKSSSGCSFNAGVPGDKVEVLKGEPKVYKDMATTSGQPVYRNFCPNCGSALWSTVVSMDGQSFIKVGTMDNAEEIQPIGQGDFKHALLAFKDTAKVPVF